jgi:diaminohydroxyphosphoribosylaminopyrimidine deaminase/5-amino-6-(5-phosphoribosylamino)uracil reductase
MKEHVNDSELMQKALELANTGKGWVSPNPLVGCVITDAEGKIIGQGAHLEFGGNHAEVNAILDAESRGHSVQRATVYVTLEPCSHFGKTPPCADHLVEKRIGRCVVAMLDPNPNVSGKGIERLLANGVNVEVGLLEKESRELNRFYLKHLASQRPYVTLKIGSSLDGRSALASGVSKWITSAYSRKLVHEMRSQYDAILIGSGTALADDPELTTHGLPGKQPKRIVLDRKLALPTTLKLFSDEHRESTIVITTPEAIQASTSVTLLESQSVRLIGIPETNAALDLSILFRILGEEGIASVLVEAGSGLAAGLVSSRLIDELVLFYSPMLLGGDAKPIVGNMGVQMLEHAPCFRLHSVEVVEGSDDIVARYRNTV